LALSFPYWFQERKHRQNPKGKAMKNNDKALNAFLESKVRIDAAIEAIAKASAGHFGAMPEDVTWTDVAGLQRLAAALEGASEVSGV
jgi:hypothetical protein